MTMAAFSGMLKFQPSVEAVMVMVIVTSHLVKFVALVI